MKQWSEVNRGTPNITVFRNDNLAVRQLGYCRCASEIAKTRISIQRYDSAGRLKISIDPRLSVAYLKESFSITPNHQQVNTLRGSVLKTDNVDSGVRISVSSCDGLMLWNCDSRGVEQNFAYDVLRRVKTVTEKERGKETVCYEQFFYGKISNASQRNNLVGQLVDHFDTAGRRHILAYSLLGAVINEKRTFLKTATKVDWTDDEQKNEQYLEGQAYSSHWQLNALGEVIQETDAANNKHLTHYTIAGQIVQQSLRLQDGKEKILSRDQVYNASGQLLQKTLGNGILLNYTYEVKTQRLHNKKAIRVPDNIILQSLAYTYDPIGNILVIQEHTRETQYYKNTKAESIYQYIYDSLYQLIEAIGLESDQAGREPSRLPKAIRFGNQDASCLVTYQRNYFYDKSGNLYEVQHHGAKGYTRRLTIDTASNRGVEKRALGPSLAKSFDANGNLLYLDANQPLTLNSDNRNQLQGTVQVERKESISDQENYVYDGLGMRVQKTRQFLSENQIHTERVRYLSGLELRERWQTDLDGQNKRITEAHHLIQTQTNNTSVKVLYWESGKPNEVENNSIYFSLTDQIGSHQIELNRIGEIINIEAYYPYGGTAIWSTKNQIESSYKVYRYSGKECDHSGLYYYSYRYYIPWLGRWLNPDPSGIEDGLNLFRMVHNNPIIFYDSDGKAPIEKNYQLERGDLIYGLNEPREKYFNKIKARLVALKGKEWYFIPVFIDSYNRVLTSITLSENKNLGDYFRKTPQELAKSVTLPENIKELVSEQQPSFFWDKYFSIGAENPKFNIKNIFQEVSENYGSSQYHKWLKSPYTGGTAPRLLFKRASKLGFEMVANSEMRIHFVLDKLNLLGVVNKQGEAGSSITASELRYAYRNWEKLKEKVHFYKGGTEVPAPWEQNSALWAKYKPKNKSKKELPLLP